MIRSLPFLFIASLLSLTAQGQSISRKVKEFKSGEISSVSVDRLGDFFLILKNGAIRKYDAQGKVMASLTHQKNVPALIEPWYHPSIFIYHREKQTYSFYDRNFENAREYKLEPEFAIEPYLVCPSNDNKLWIFDHADFSLKKANYFSNEVLTEFSLDSTQFSVTPEFIYLREYQNMLFLHDKHSGIIIVNNIGKQIHYIQDGGIGNFNFFGEELYYISGNIIHFFDLYSKETREIKLDGNNKYALVTDERIVVIGANNTVTLFEYHPPQ